VSDADIKRLARQNETIIVLLGRLAFKREEVKEIVTFKKRGNPEKYVRGYNACDGKHTVSEIAAVAGVDQSTATPILQQWEDAGIVFEVENQDTVKKGGGKFYKKIFPI
jgi:DNA-binding MarR family transcriptional regulator